MAYQLRKNITFESRTWTDDQGHLFLKDVDRNECVRCSGCKHKDHLWLGHVIIVRRDGEKEQIFCAGCWPKNKDSIEWVGAQCAIVYHNFARSLVWLTHELLDQPFSRLTQLDSDAFLLFGAGRKERQQDLFAEAGA